MQCAQMSFSSRDKMFRWPFKKQECEFPFCPGVSREFTCEQRDLQRDAGVSYEV